MSNNQDYAEKHQKILDKLNAQGGAFAYCGIGALAVAVDMDPRTVRGHLEVIELDKAGVFLDADKNLFATKAGIIVLAKKLGMRLASTRARGKAKHRRIGIDRSSPKWRLRRGGP